MPRLTPERWAEFYTDLRVYVQEQWPDIDEGKLRAIVGDFDAVVDLLASAHGISPSVAREQLLALEVDDIALQRPAGQPAPASLDELRLGPGFAEDERAMVVGNLAKLNRQLRRFPADAAELEVSVQERDRPTQEVVLESWLPHLPHMAATSTQEDLGMALREVRDNLWRQIDEAVNRRMHAR